MFGLFRKKYRWYKVFASREEAKQKVPLNKAVGVQLEDKQICLARTSQGFFALEDHCPHQGGTLHQGHCTENAYIVCPWHQYQFSLHDGKHATGLEEDVPTYPVKVSSKGISIGLKK